MTTYLTDNILSIFDKNIENRQNIVYNIYQREGDKMKKYVWETPEEINLDLAKRVKQVRKRRGITQQELSAMSGVSYGSIKRFETSGNISLISLTKIAVALDAVNGVKALFTDIPYRTIEEVINEQK